MGVETMSLYTAGGVVVAAAAWLFVTVVRRFGKKAQVDASADDRALALVKISEGIANQLREDNTRLQGEIFESTRRYATLAETMQGTIERVHREHREAMQHVHERLDKTEAEVKDCNQRHLKCEESLAELRNTQDRRSFGHDAAITELRAELAKCQGKIANS